ncbi:hypothetical protein BC827DRAFT_1271237 [Russula dissimulans]|nr:hypothetical protein BC827DRAFT_1271237 [Russula dissimulans]
MDSACDDVSNTANSQDRFLLHSDDPCNFLKLCAALRVLVRCRLTNQDIDHAEGLIQEYCTELIPLYGMSVIKLNHHYATHVAECIRNFGPLHDFWTFLYERLNKVLKSFKTNNHGQGDLETTFFTKFHKTCQTSCIAYTMLCYPKDSLLYNTAEIMLKATNEECGTVAGLAALSQALDEEHLDVIVIIRFDIIQSEFTTPDQNDAFGHLSTVG